MHLNAVVRVLVGILTVHAFSQRCKRIGQTAVLFEFRTLFGIEFAFAADVLQCLIDIDIACCLVKQCTTGIETSLDIGNHFCHSRELDDGFAELLAVCSICHSLVISSLRKTYALSSNAQTSTIHQRHYIFDETKFAVTTEFALRILVDEFAGWTSVDAKFVLDATNINTAIALVVDEHRKTTTIACSCLRTGKHKMDVAVAVGDETFRAIQTPAVVLLVESCLEHNALQVATCIRLCEVHRHRFALADTRNVLLALLLVAEAIECFYAVLQTPDVLETCIAGRNNFVCCSVNRYRKIEATIAAGHRHAVQAGMVHCLEVLVGFRSITYTTIFAMRSFGINFFRIRSHNIGNDVAHDVQHLVVTVHGIGKVLRSLFVLVFICVAALFQFDDTLHQGAVFEFELYLFYVVIIVCHFTCCFAYNT